MKEKIELTAEMKYQLLRDISHKIRDTLDLDRILNLLLDLLSQIIQYDAAGIFILSEDIEHPSYYFPNQKIAGIAKRGYFEQPVASDEMLSKGKGIIGYVISSKASIILDDVQKDSRYVIGRPETLSEMAVPIIKNEKAIGALNVESDDLSAFDISQLEILQFFADAASISIEKAILHQQILEKKKLEEQIKIAKDVHSSLLPANPPQIYGYDIAGICIPAYEIGGDYYDYIQLDTNNMGIVLADVSGDGVPAALIMSAFRAVLLNEIKQTDDPAEIMNSMNQKMSEVTRRRDFITALYGILNHKEHIFNYSNSGHNPPILLHSNSELEMLEGVGPSLNIVKDAKFISSSISLLRGDLIVFYTDGVTDEFDADSTEFGLERLKKVILDCKEKSAEGIIQYIINSTKNFLGKKNFRDDFTLVVLKRT